MKRIIPLFLLLAFTACKKSNDAAAATPYTISPYSKVYGATGDDYFYAAIATSDSGIISVGKTNSTELTHSTSYTDIQAWIVKTDVTGKEVWEKTLGGSADDEAYAVIAAPDGGFVVAGRTKSMDGDFSAHFGGDYDLWIAKFNQKGEKIWSSTFGGSGEEFAASLVAANNGGYIIAGYTNSTDGDITSVHGTRDACLVKVDEDGKMVWQKSYGGYYYEQAQSIIKAPGGGYVFAGATESNDGDVSGNNGAGDYWLVKVDESGTIVWQKTYGGTNFDDAYAVTASSDGGYLLVGESGSKNGEVTSSHAGSEDWLVKTDGSGNIQWQKTIGGTYQEIGKSVFQTKDGGYIIGGTSGSTDGDITGHHGNADIEDAWIVKISASGDMLWQHSFGTTWQDIPAQVVAGPGDFFTFSGYSPGFDGDITAGYTGIHGNMNSWVVRFKP